MPKQEPEDGCQAGSGVARKVRLLVEILLRAGLLVIPAVGSALEKAAFGIKDASAADEVLSLVRTVEQTLREHVEEQHVLSEAEIEALSQAILERSLSPKLIEAFEAVSDKVFLLLIEVFAQVSSQTGVLQKLQQETRLAHEALLKQQDEIVKEVRLQAERRDQLLGVLLEQAGSLQENPQTPPAELLRTFGNSEVLLALACAESAIEAVRSHAERAEAIVAADFSELWSFAQKGIGGDDLYPATIALFRHSRVPVLALPGTLQEIRSFLWLESRGLLRASADLASGRALKLEPASRLVGLQSLHNAVHEDILQPWKGPPLQDELRMIEARAARLLVRFKGRRRPPSSIRSDATNIAFLIQMAVEVRDDRKEVVFVTRDKAFEPAVRAIKARMDFPCPQIVNPLEWAFDSFLRSDAIGTALRRDALQLSVVESDLSSIWRGLVGALRSSSADEIIGIQTELGLFIATLSACRSSVRGFSDWLTTLAETETATIARDVWGHGVMEAYATVIRALTGLDRYVANLARAFAPFQQD